MYARNLPASRLEISRNEIYWLAAAIFVGAFFRLSFPGRMAIEHFDEGVYASNIWFGSENDYSYPARYLYAPPLLPTSIEWTMILALMSGVRPDGFIPMIPCLAAGIAMIPSVWWVGRQWFGQTAGLIAAWLVATSDFHASYSRAALTDVPVCLFILWAVYFTGKSFVLCLTGGTPSHERKTSKASGIVPPYPWRNILLAGGFTGLAWWTKYNGWLPLAIGAAGASMWQFLASREERQIRRVLICWTLIAVVAAIVWMPVLWGLQKYHGYAEVAANHRNYAVGFKGWGDSVYRQAEHIGEYDNWFGLFTEPLNVSEHDYAIHYRDHRLSEAFSDLQIPGRRWAGFTIVAHKLIWWANRFAIFAVPTVLLVITGIALWIQRRNGTSIHQVVGGCLLAAWFGGMTVATPFYYPYPRLVFPWLTATWLGMGLAVQLWQNRRAATDERKTAVRTKPWSLGRFEWILIVWMTANCVVRSVEGTAHAFEDRTGLAVAATEISKQIEQEIGASGDPKKRVIICVWGEPALVFGLRANGFANVVPVANMESLNRPQPVPTYLVFGKQSFESGEFQNEFKRLELCQRIPIQPSHLVEMDSLKSVKMMKIARGATVWLFRVKG